MQKKQLKIVKNKDRTVIVRSFLVVFSAKHTPCAVEMTGEPSKNVPMELEITLGVVKFVFGE